MGLNRPHPYHLRPVMRPVEACCIVGVYYDPSKSENSDDTCKHFAMSSVIETIKEPCDCT